MHAGRPDMLIIQVILVFLVVLVVLAKSYPPCPVM